MTDSERGARRSQRIQGGDVLDIDVDTPELGAGERS